MLTYSEARRERFIPARAGNTWRSPFGVVMTPVHPRSRGEHISGTDTKLRNAGSSPLARGTLPYPTSTEGCRRFIPARAGNTAARPCRPAHTSVHPRSRGEHESRFFFVRGVDGSSPLARGTPAGEKGFFDQVRFIPARAGNTPAGARTAPGWPVHPRSRGEHCRRTLPARPHIGSSPLARGTRLGLLIPDDPVRFIPARAGNTPGAALNSMIVTVHPRSRGEHRPCAE